MKILTVLGARPQFVKAAMVSRELAKRGIDEVLVHTGQHFDPKMSEIFFTELKIPKPQYHFGINGQSHDVMLAQMLEDLHPVALHEKPDWILVYGDTTSTLAGAYTARDLGIRLVHVEAGLRSYNSQMIEESNRIQTDQLSDLLCCPTKQAMANLHAENLGLGKQKILFTGDVMLDAVHFYSQMADSLRDDSMPFATKPFVLCTVHRAENTDDPQRLKNIFKALSKLHQEISVILPLHPRTRKMLSRWGLDEKSVQVVEPVGYLSMLKLLKICELVLTDSGGLQKEAYFLSKPCVTLRDETEWTELTAGGYNRLAGSDPDRILDCVEKMRGHKVVFDPELYGSGQAAKKIVDAIWLGHVARAPTGARMDTQYE